MSTVVMLFFFVIGWLVGIATYAVVLKRVRHKNARARLHNWDEQIIKRAHKLWSNSLE